MDEPIQFDNVGSGTLLSEPFYLAIIDYDNQIMNLDSSSLIKISSVTENASVIGFNTYSVTNGIARFNKTGFVYEPGGIKVSYKASSNNISNDFLDEIQMPNENNITVNFRF